MVSVVTILPGFASLPHIGFKVTDNLEHCRNMPDMHGRGRVAYFSNRLLIVKKSFRRNLQAKMVCMLFVFWYK